MNVTSRPDPHVLLADLAFPESPRWYDGRLWVSDWGANEVIAVDPAGQSEVVARVRDLTAGYRQPSPGATNLRMLSMAWAL